MPDRFKTWLAGHRQSRRSRPAWIPLGVAATLLVAVMAGLPRLPDSKTVPGEYERLPAAQLAPSGERGVIWQHPARGGQPPVPIGAGRDTIRVDFLQSPFAGPRSHSERV